VIQRSIPYPLVLVLRCEGQEAPEPGSETVQSFREGRDRAEEFVNTGWMNLTTSRHPSQSSFDSIALNNLPQSTTLRCTRHSSTESWRSGVSVVPVSIMW